MFIILLAVTALSCQNHEIVNDTIGKNPVVTKTNIRGKDNRYNVTIEEVQKIAEVLRRESLREIQPIEKEGEILLYICNFQEGWMIIAGDKRAKPVLAESQEGRFSIGTVPIGVSVWLESLATEILDIKQYAQEENLKILEEWDLVNSALSIKKAPQTKGGTEKWYAVNSGTVLTNLIEIDVIPHLITTKWGQDYPWNTKCPYDLDEGETCPLGCMATALGQLLYYTHYNLLKPNRLYHTINCSVDTINGETNNIGFSRGDLNIDSPRWNSMAVNKYGTSLGIEYVGDLMLDIGNRFNFNYSGAGSGTVNMSSSILSTYYGLSYSSGNYDYSTVLANLNSSKPVLISAYSTCYLGLYYTNGHMWLIDGSHQTTRTYTYYKHFEYSEDWIYYNEVYDTFAEIHQIYHIQDPNEEIECTTTTTTNYLLMNWGYDGLFDSAYYNVGANDYWNANNHNHQYLRTIYYDIL